MNIGPCEPWPAIWCCSLVGRSATVTGNALMAATEVLWGLSGRQLGECTISGLRPCREECGIYSNPLYQWSWDANNGWPYPSLVDGRWYNLGCAGGCGDSCSCNTVHQFTLPLNVNRVSRIVIDGDVVPTGSYQVYNWRYVVRSDGGEWPWCNDPAILSGPGAWSVDVVVGDEVPVIGQMAAGELACQIMQLCCNEECELPVNARRVTRQGVTVDTPELTTIVATGSLGLPYVNEFLAMVNPSQIKSRSRSYSPDTMRTRFPT